jgi:hypothetical protein
MREQLDEDADLKRQHETQHPLQQIDIRLEPLNIVIRAGWYLYRPRRIAGVPGNIQKLS